MGNGWQSAVFLTLNVVLLNILILGWVVGQLPKGQLPLAESPLKFEFQIPCVFLVFPCPNRKISLCQFSDLRVFLRQNWLGRHFQLFRKICEISQQIIIAIPLIFRIRKFTLFWQNFQIPRIDTDFVLTFSLFSLCSRDPAWDSYLLAHLPENFCLLPSGSEQHKVLLFGSIKARLPNSANGKNTLKYWYCWVVKIGNTLEAVHKPQYTPWPL